MAKYYQKNDRKCNAENVSDTDRIIREYIQRIEDDDYTDAIKEETNLEIFFHLSDLRSGLFSWYDFHEQAKLLEINAGFGGLTSFLCTKVSHVTAWESSKYKADTLYMRCKSYSNLEIYNTNWDEFIPMTLFDYIIINEDTENVFSNVYENRIQYIKKFLKPEGILLIALDNRFGLKYFCGDVGEESQLPFTNIANLENKKLLSKNEIKRFFSKEGFENIKFYYPLPDYKFPQLIYTDAYLPQNDIKERLIPYYNNQRTLLATEMELYEAIISNKVFGFFSNSYLIECGNEKNFSPVIYATISTDRGRDKAFATSVREDGVVHKKPVYFQGIDYAKRVIKQSNALQKYNIPILPQVWNNEKIIMPRVEAPTLATYLKQIVKTDITVFISLLDQLWANILQSSEIVDAKYNRLKRNGKLDYGPILKKAYLELIPLNCFFDDGKFLFFDQEYVQENYPAKYILFRAIHYIYAFSPYIEKYVPLTTLKERYKLSDLWEEFFYEEDSKFLPKVRKHDAYKQFYERSKVDKKQMKKNARYLKAFEKINKELLFVDIQGKDIVIFGAGAFFDDYMQIYGKEFPPFLVVDNNVKKWGIRVNGIEIKAPTELENLEKRNLHLIICSRYYKEIGKQLYEMGIQFYKVYPNVFV